MKNAEQVRNSITQKELKNIQKLYEGVYQEITKKIASIGNNNLQKQNLILLQRDIKKRLQNVSNEIQTGITNDMNVMCNAVVEDTRKFLKQCGFKDEDIHEAFMFVPDEIVRNITTGQIYQEGWSFSSAIWKDVQKTQTTINTIVANGTAQGKSAYEIAKDLESYVDPSASKQAKTIKSWRYATKADVEAGRAKNIGDRISDRFYPGKIDYNALRLARTLVSHAYQQSFERVNRNDPFVTKYRWLTSNFHGRVCPICLERSGKLFNKNELPLDHPNGMCTFEAVIPYTMDEIAEKIGKWYQAPIGTYPEIDKYATDFLGGM